MSGRDNLRERAISAAVWMFVQSWGGQICNLVVFVILARLLPPEAFGLVAYASVVTGLLQVVANAGLSQAVIRYERLDPAYLDTAFWTQVGIATGIASSIVLGSDVLASLMGDAALGPILRWLSLGFVVGSLSSTQQAFMRRRLRVRPLAMRTLSANVFGGFIGATMAFSGLGVWSLVGQQLSASVMATLVLWKSAEWRPGLRFSRSHLREMLGFGMAMTGSNLLRVLTDRLDRLMIGHLMGAAALGLYVVGFRALRLVIELVSTPINSISLPVFARLQGNLVRMRAGVDRAAALNGLIALPAATGLVVVAPDLVPLAFGEQWMASVPIMQLLAVFGVCQAIYAINAPILVARGRADWMVQISVVSALVTLVGIALVYRFGLVAVAGVIAVRGLVVLPVFLLGSAHLLERGLLSMLAPYRTSALASAVMVAACLGVGFLLPDAAPALRLPASVAVGGVVYVVTVRVVSPHLFREAVEIVQQSLVRRGRGGPAPVPASSGDGEGGFPSL